MSLSRTGVVRTLALAALIAVAAAVAIAVLGGGGGYRVRAEFLNAGQLVRGNPVQRDGVRIGEVTGIHLAPNGLAEVEMKIDDRFAPLRRGTRATVRAFSLSGVANRYVDLDFPPNGSPPIPDGGRIDSAHTQTAVDIDQLFNTLDARTRRDLQRFFKGNRDLFVGVERQANAGLRYLSPSLSTSSRLFAKLAEDEPLLERFLVDTARFNSVLASRADRLTPLVSELADTTQAIASERQALADAIAALPPFMRRANTTFVNLRSAVRDLDPLVAASRPAARELVPFLAEARRLSTGSPPTIRELVRAIQASGGANDLIDLLRSVPPLAQIALDARERRVAPGGRLVDVGRVRGAIPETADAFRAGAPELAVARFYATDFLGWLDDFSTTGAGFDALGAMARAHISVAEVLAGGPARRGQYKRCPGSAEAPARDGSNVLPESVREFLQCEESARATGDVR